MLRAEELAARAPRIVGTVNDYWVQRRKQREATRRKRGEGGPAGSQATVKKKNKKDFLADHIEIIYYGK